MCCRTGMRRLEAILSDIDPQFAAIFTLVTVFQVSLVAYARNQPYIEPETIDDLPIYSRVLMPDRVPEPKRASEDRTEGSKAPSARPKPAKTAGPKSIAPADVRRKGMLGAIGRASRDDGAVSDVFDEGRTNRALDEAFTGIGGVELGTVETIEGRRGGGDGGVDIFIGHGRLGDVALDDKRERLAPSGDAEPQGPAVDGSLTEAEVARAMKRYVGALKACYEGALKVNRRLGGKLVLKFEVSSEGRTQNLAFEAAGLRSGEVEECIGRRARHWRFPRSEGTAFVEYPILFTPGS
jgi:hypothetical protein